MAEDKYLDIGEEEHESKHPKVQQSLFARWPAYQPTTEVDWVQTNNFNGFRILSYIFLYVNLILQVIGSPLQIGRYIWVMLINIGTVRGDILEKVFTQQKDAMFACIALIFTEPFAIIWLFMGFLWNICLYFWYNVVWLWRVIDITFGFTADGVLTALTRMFALFEYMVTDYQGFTNKMAENIWSIAAVLVFWPFYIAWIWFVWIFDLNVDTSLW